MTEWRGATLPAYRRIFVDSNEALGAVLPELDGHPAMAVDVEMGQRVHRKPGGVQEWEHILALIQLAAGGLSVVIDPLRCSVSPLRNLMAGSTRNVFLGGGQDAALLAKAGIPARNIIDVGEVAYALYGRREDGMAALSRRIFGISLDKTVRRTDWMARPLNPTLLAYAHRDAELTLGIFEWFREQHADILAFHQRPELDPELPGSAPPWLRDALLRSSGDALGVVMAHDLDPVSDADRLAEEIRPYLREVEAPRLLNRLIRVAGDLRLRPLLPAMLALSHSPSSLIRASAARAIGMMATPADGESRVQELTTDDIEDVRKSALAALREMKAPVEPVSEPEEPGDEPGIDGDALSALMRLKAELENQ